ncbi:MAG TPA: tRNA (adenosine(37)-N6)-dimethylallyltransferase MiaA [Bryobacteraceae bacterium]|nr:tRNA (adenosine(37)-N6)-dimethylallyltransferase MiaA [Bryobacteraceae bacterium]
MESNTPKLPGTIQMDVAPLPLVAIAGPTGSGKSELALGLAEEFAGEIVNCDSLQVYRHFDLGTAKLPLSGRRGIPHHLIDIADPDEVFTAGEYARRARAAIAGISSRGKLPIVAGGTGFYLRALLDGLFAGPERDEALRARLARREGRRPGSLHRILRRLDPAAAGAIHPRDVPKVTRALEICLLTRRRASDLFRAGRDSLRGYRTLKIGLDPDRDALYARLDERSRRMFECGLAAEVERILALGFPPEAKPFESHGYKQALQMLRGELNWKEAVFYTQRNTRRYAKRQMTWFRQESGIVWLKGFGEEPGVRAAAGHLVRNFLTN